MKESHKYFKVYIFLAIYSFALLIFCAGSSPFINYMSTDSSVFFTMGRSMAHRKVPYLDLFDHKGWYIYFINYIGALISSNNSIGLYIVEAVFISLDAILCYHIYFSLLYDDNKSIISSLITILLCLNYFTYQGGNLVEVYALTFQFLSFYLVVNYTQKNQIKHNPIYMIIHGICVGVVLFLRANMIMMWGSIAIVILMYLAIRKQYLNAFINIIAGVVGIIIGIAPPILYAILTGSLAEMFNQSFAFNLLYSSGGNILKNVLGSFRNVTFAVVLLGGVVSAIVVCISRKVRLLVKLLFVTGFMLSAFSVSFSPFKFEHYLEYIIPFYIPIIILLVNKLKLKQIKMNRCLLALFICCTFILSVCANLRMPIKLFVTNNASKSYMQAVNEISNEFLDKSKGDEKVLVVNNNSAFYNAMHVIPSTKYFYTPLVKYNKYPYAVDSQVQSIISGENDVIIISYLDDDNKVIYSSGVDNDEIIKYIHLNYTLSYSVNDFQMWSKNEEG